MALTTQVGKYQTYNSSFVDELVVGLAALVEPRLSVTWDLFPEVSPVNTETIKWFDAKSNALEGEVRTGGWNDTDTTGLVITDATAAVINIGDVLRVEDEFVVVKAVDRTVAAATIDVFARGHGGSTAAAHVATTVIYIVGNGNVEGTVDGDSIIEDNVERKNYFQILEEPLQITHTAKNQKYEDIEDKMLEARRKAMSRAMRKMNGTCLLGVADAGCLQQPLNFAKSHQNDRKTGG